MEFSKTFKDALGREWIVDLPVATLRRLAQAPLSFRLDDILPAKASEAQIEADVSKYQTFLDDDLRFADVLFAIVKPQAVAVGITQEQFEEGLKGEANQQAILAFHQAFTDFSHGPRRTVLRALKLKMQKAEELGQVVERRLGQKAQEMTPEKMETMLDGLALSGKHELNGATASAPAATASSKPATATPAT